MALLGEQFTTIYDMDKDFAINLGKMLEESTVDLLKNLETSIKSVDVVHAKNLLHTLKGSAANFGAEDLSYRARDTEMAIHLLNTENIAEYIKQLKIIEDTFKQTMEELATK